MIKCTYRDLDRVRDAVPNVAGPVSKLRLLSDKQPLLADRAKIMRLCRALVSEITEYEKVLVEILAKYGTPSKDNPNNYLLPPDKLAAYDEEKIKILDTECEIAYPSKLPTSAFDQVPLSADDLERLEPFVELPKE